jgi:hypothetical protein
MTAIGVMVRMPVMKPRSGMAMSQVRTSRVIFTLFLRRRPYFVRVMDETRRGEVSHGDRRRDEVGSLVGSTPGRGREAVFATLRLTIRL